MKFERWLWLLSLPKLTFGANGLCWRRFFLLGMYYTMLLLCLVPPWQFFVSTLDDLNYGRTSMLLSNICSLLFALILYLTQNRLLNHHSLSFSCTTLLYVTCVMIVGPICTFFIHEYTIQKYMFCTILVVVLDSMFGI